MGEYECMLVRRKCRSLPKGNGQKLEKWCALINGRPLKIFMILNKQGLSIFLSSLASGNIESIGQPSVTVVKVNWKY